MLDEHIVRSIIDMFIFLEFTEDSHMNGDTAIPQMEALAVQLQRASEPTQLDLATQIRDLASGYGERSDFVRELPQMIGLE